MLDLISISFNEFAKYQEKKFIFILFLKKRIMGGYEIQKSSTRY